MASIMFVEPAYEDLIGLDERPTVCDRCGAVVGDNEKHTEFHRALTKLINTALTNKQIRGITE